jgi:hypothetical protein
VLIDWSPEAVAIMRERLAVAAHETAEAI